MKCNEIATYIADYLEGELDKERTDELLDHVETCEACRAEFRAWQEQETQLRRYFQLERERAERLTEPPRGLIPEAEAAERARSPLRWIAWAAAAVLCLAVGIGGWSVYRRVVPRGEAQLAKVKASEGRVLALDAGSFALPGTPVRQSERLKVESGGYLALELADGNIVEARGGTQLRLQDFPDRTELSMRRGQVWVHLKRKPAKMFLVRTAHLTAAATGTVYGVEEGLDRSVVAVAEGTVLVECGGIQVQLAELNGYTSREGAVAARDALSTLWSRYQEDLAALAPPPDARAALPPPLLSIGTMVSASVAAASLNLVDYLPENTRHFLEIRDWQGLLREFQGTDYLVLFREQSLREWWEAVGARKVLDEVIKETQMRTLLEIGKRIDGQIVFAVTAKGDVLLLADCGANAAEVRDLLEAMWSEGNRELNPDTAEERLARFREQVFVDNGRLAVSNKSEVAQLAAARIRMDKPSGFSASAFYGKLLRDLGENPRFLMASNLGGQIADLFAPKEGREVNADMEAMLELSGLRSLDYFLLSPSFAGNGMNQAARLAFVDAGRSGAMNWLAEPGPMRGLDFFSPDVHFFAAAVLRNPYQMFLDYLAFLQNSGAERNFNDALTFVARNQAFFASFGGEVAVGIDNPILPIPNVKIVIEVMDRAAFQQGLDQLVLDVQKDLARRGTAALVETTEYKGRVIRSLVIENIAGTLISPSWTFVDDYCVAGPGPQFVRNSLDVYDSGRSIANDSRLASLLPTGRDVQFSLLAYQDVAKTIPAFVREKIAATLRPADANLVPNLNFLENYRAPGIAYAYARPECVDVYLKAPRGIDFNFGMAFPLVANWLMPRTNLGAILTRLAATQLALEKMQEAVTRFQAQNGRLPLSLAELAQPAGVYIDRIPEDPFGLVSGETLRLIAGPAAGQITIYSIGPDGMDDQGLLEYDVLKQYDGPGDIFVRIAGGGGE